jgi:hypothetical protein
MIISGILGIMVGSVFSFWCTTRLEVMAVVSELIVPVVSAAFSVVPMKMVLEKDYGEFRIVLLSTSPPLELPARTQPSTEP